MGVPLGDVTANECLTLRALCDSPCPIVKPERHLDAFFTRAAVSGSSTPKKFSLGSSCYLLMTRLDGETTALVIRLTPQSPSANLLPED